MTHRPKIAAAMLLAATSSACDISVFVPIPELGGPAGAISGQVTYSGPPPCTKNGRVDGAAVLLAFEEKLLPPPEGLGTNPANLTVVAGELLFRGVRHELAFAADGSKLCPPKDAAPIVVSAPFALSPLQAGVYQVRGFFDYDGDFNAGFSLFNLPTKGDIGGGAIANAAEALQGAPVVYRGIPIGDEQNDGSRIIPSTGSLISGVSVSLGLPLPLERPIFHIEKVLDETFGNSDPSNVVVPCDYQLTNFDVANPAATEQSFVRLVLGAGTSAEDTQAGLGAPFSFPLQDPHIFVSRQDADGNGIKDANDHIPETSLVPALLPLGLLTKLEGQSIDSQGAPSIILQGVTLLDNLLSTAASPPSLAELRKSVVVGLRPAVLCIDRAHPEKGAILLNTHKTDKQGNTLVADEAALEARLSAQFGRPVKIQYGCLPQGRYGINLVYETGQAWTVPNEAGVCAPTEPFDSSSNTCGIRPKLDSQSLVVTIGAPQDAAYCQANPTPSACLPSGG